jgi:ribosomal protein S18 acetylase RimI-like enzyme
VLQPYCELEDYGSLYISAVAVFSQYRGLRIGSILLAEAQRRAQRLAQPRLSLICFEGNHRALRLYQRLGYQESDRRPIVPHPSLHYSDGDAVLMVRTVPSINSTTPESTDGEIQT